MKLHLLRHGLTEPNEKQLLYGRTDVPLSEKGVRELVELKKTIKYPKADLHMTSALKRSVETLRLLYSVDEWVTVPEWNEYDCGEFEMKHHDELKDREDYINWLESFRTVASPGGESGDDFYRRVADGFEKVVNTGASRGAKSVVAVCHGGVIAALMEIFCPGERMFAEWLPSGGRGYSLTVESTSVKEYGAI